MNNNSSFEEVTFAQYLLEKHIIKTGTEKFYVHWVRSFLRERKKWLGYTWNDQLSFFLKALNLKLNIHDWQVQQADQAIRLYFTAFLKERGGVDNASPLISPGKDGRYTTESALLAFREALRLKNYAHRTEKTYLQKTKEFLCYTSKNNKAFHTLELNDIKGQVRDFLAYLAIHKKISASSQKQSWQF